jgi:hypothetical protein
MRIDENAGGGVEDHENRCENAGGGVEDRENRLECRRRCRGS